MTKEESITQVAIAEIEMKLGEYEPMPEHANQKYILASLFQSFIGLKKFHYRHDFEVALDFW